MSLGLFEDLVTGRVFEGLVERNGAGGIDRGQLADQRLDALSERGLVGVLARHADFEQAHQMLLGFERERGFPYRQLEAARCGVHAR